MPRPQRSRPQSGVSSQRSVEEPLAVWGLDPTSDEFLFCNRSAQFLFRWKEGLPQQAAAHLSEVLFLSSPQEDGPKLLEQLRGLVMVTEGALVPATWRRPTTEQARNFHLNISRTRIGSRDALVLVAREAAAEHAPAGSAATVSAEYRCIAHELNNIAGSLRGFVDLAEEVAAPEAPGQRYFPEQRLGVRRLTGLANTLESLAESPSQPAMVALSVCMERALENLAATRPPWTSSCPVTQAVCVDLYLAQRALRCLYQLAEVMTRGREALAFHVRQRTETESRCLACGVPIATDSIAIYVQTARSEHYVQRVKRSAHAAPSYPELIQRALVQSAHNAGGHLLGTVDSAPLGIALPGS